MAKVTLLPLLYTTATFDVKTARTRCQYLHLDIDSHLQEVAKLDLVRAVRAARRDGGVVIVGSG